MKKPKPPEYIPTGKTAEGREEIRKLIELAILRGWAHRSKLCATNGRPAPGKGDAWGWGK